MHDIIEINDLLLRTIIGINPEERTNRQDVLISTRLYCDTRPAAKTDHIDDAINYRTICKQMIELVESTEFYLVEKLASAIAELCLHDARIQRVTVSVHKPGALRFANNVGVVIDRTRADFE